MNEVRIRANDEYEKSSNEEDKGILVRLTKKLMMNTLLTTRELSQRINKI